MVCERAGKGLLDGLKRADPLMPKGCMFQQPCTIEDKFSCWASRVIYCHECLQCGAQYLGTTGHTCHKRTLEHMDALERGDTSYPLTKHILAKHPELDLSGGMPFKTRIVGRNHIPGNLHRFLTEAVAIAEAKAAGADLLNSKGEWGRVRLQRLALVDE